MTIRPRHYAQLITADGAEQAAERVAQLTALASVRRDLAALSGAQSRATIGRVLADQQVDELAQSITLDLMDRGRLHWLPAIARTAEQLLADRGEPAVAHITTARSEVVNVEQLKSTLAELIGPIGSVQVTVEPDALGGIRIRIADQALDARLSSRLDRVRTALLA